VKGNKSLQKTKHLYILKFDVFTMRRIGFLIDEEREKALDTIMFLSGKKKTELLKEGVDVLVANYKEKHDNFDHVFSIKNSG